MERTGCMGMPESGGGSERGRELLRLARPVSRSFYLSLKFLPCEMRTSVTLAYLLARLSDSIADFADAPGGERLDAVEALRESPEKWCAPAFAKRLPPGEGELVVRLPFLLESLSVSRDRQLILSTWQTILRGQSLDARRAADGSGSRAMPFEDVLAYAGDVAGVVGEFWTRLAGGCLREPFRCATESLLVPGRRYGVALQLLNILRDRPSDLAGGRCYLADEDIPSAIRELRAGLEAAAFYVSQIRPTRLYIPSTLPAAIASQMLTNLSRPSFKISRKRIYLSLLAVAIRRDGIRDRLRDA